MSNRKGSRIAAQIIAEEKRKEIYKNRKMKKEDFKDSNEFLNNMVDGFINDMQNKVEK